MSETSSTAPESIEVSSLSSSVPEPSPSSLTDKSQLSANHIKLIGGLLVLSGVFGLWNISTAISDDKGNTNKQRINYCRIGTNSGFVLLGGWLVAKPDQWNKPHVKWVFAGLIILEFILYMVKRSIKY